MDHWGKQYLDIIKYFHSIHLKKHKFVFAKTQWLLKHRLYSMLDIIQNIRSKGLLH